MESQGALSENFLFAYHWLKNSLTRKEKVHTKAAIEMLVRRMFQIHLQLVEQYGLTVDVTLVRSEQSQRTDKCATKIVHYYKTKKRDDTGCL